MTHLTHSHTKIEKIIEVKWGLQPNLEKLHHDVDCCSKATETLKELASSSQTMVSDMSATFDALKKHAAEESKNLKKEEEKLEKARKRQNRMACGKHSNSHSELHTWTQTETHVIHSWSIYRCHCSCMCLCMCPTDSISKSISIFHINIFFGVGSE